MSGLPNQRGVNEEYSSSSLSNGDNLASAVESSPSRNPPQGLSAASPSQNSLGGQPVPERNSQDCGSLRSNSLQEIELQRHTWNGFRLQPKIEHCMENIEIIPRGDPNEACAICMDGFNDKDSCYFSDSVVEVKGCGHQLHRHCFSEYIKSTSGAIICVYCKLFIASAQGNQPKGTVQLLATEAPCSGYENVGTYILRYYFPRSDEHVASLTSCYVPCTPEGDILVQTLIDAFKNGHTFIVGSTGKIVWNGILHKTRRDGGSIFGGYPDDNYFPFVFQQLKNKGIFPFGVMKNENVRKWLGLPAHDDSNKTIMEQVVRNEQKKARAIRRACELSKRRDSMLSERSDNSSLLKKTICVENEDTGTTHYNSLLLAPLECSRGKERSGEERRKGGESPSPLPGEGTPNDLPTPKTPYAVSAFSSAPMSGSIHPNDSLASLRQESGEGHSGESCNGLERAITSSSQSDGSVIKPRRDNANIMSRVDPREHFIIQQHQELLMYSLKRREKEERKKLLPLTSIESDASAPLVSHKNSCEVFPDSTVDYSPLSSGDTEGRHQREAKHGRGESVREGEEREKGRNLSRDSVESPKREGGHRSYPSVVVNASGPALFSAPPPHLPSLPTVKTGNGNEGSSIAPSIGGVYSPSMAGSGTVYAVGGGFTPTGGGMYSSRASSSLAGRGEGGEMGSRGLSPSLSSPVLPHVYPSMSSLHSAPALYQSGASGIGGAISTNGVGKSAVDQKPSDSNRSSFSIGNFFSAFSPWNDSNTSSPSSKNQK